MKKIIIPGVCGAISNYAMALRHMNQNYIDGKSPISLSEEFSFNNYNSIDDYYIVK
jgi:hypothetical protein